MFFKPKSYKNETFWNKDLDTIQDGLRNICTDTLNHFLLSFLYKQYMSSMGLRFFLSLVSAQKAEHQLGVHGKFVVYWL